ncbi:hypothetical protein [Falsiroseomonas tokyonensis]|uniref:Uncharacterized protein n=1 Tax=Falsiroseomonas tokyonensis TaxID=430521 RepID=A0ABV7BV64_9PROT|nr:hypothetical protein [Falsiroseomonas tokyonensis]MBU8538311.1 hypothetical protein [Falsiroseomonas tokyonensis]
MLQEIAATLTIPGLPDWSGLVVLVLLTLVGLAYLLMPFSVFGLKGRLDAIEAQLDEVQAELRTLSIRLPDAAPRRAPVEDDWAEPPQMTRQPVDAPTPRSRPPVPPPAAWPERGPARSEPRLDWPRPPR